MLCIFDKKLLSSPGFGAIILVRMDYYQSGSNLPTHDYEEDVINWEMDEFLEHRRSPLWYGVFFVVFSIFALLAYLITREVIAPVSILVMAGLVGLYSFKKPSRQKYTLTSLGLKIGSRLYDYSSFKTFSLIKDNGIAALYLITNQRFIPPITIYLPLDRDKYIIKRLSRHIAYTPSGLQWSDRLMQYFRL